MEITGKQLIQTLTPGATKTATNRKLLRLSDLVGIKIVHDTTLEVYTKNDKGEIDFNLVDIVELYALKRQIKEAISRKHAIIALMQQLKALMDMGIDEIDISGYHISRIKECSTSTT